MMSYCTVYDIINFVNVSNYCIYYNEIIYHTKVYEEMFDVTSKIDQTT